MSRPQALPRALEARLRRKIASRPRRSRAADIAIGLAAALAAVAIRYALPLSPGQIPTLTVVIAVAVTTTFVGTLAGITTAVVGGLLSWHLYFTPYGWGLTRDSLIPLVAFTIIAMVIVTTSHLYRLSEQRHHEAELEAVFRQAEAAELFAREMAHRLKNALAIVQSIAFQTLGDDSADTNKFAARLKALADAHDLLSEHVERPTANVADVVAATLEPFTDGAQRIRVECADARIAAQQAVSLALAVHELGTNASKYGALSNSRGWVSLKVEDADDRIDLAWEEHHGPQVSPPVASGFGTRLLRRVGTNTELRFDPNGVSCSLSLRKA